MRTFKCVVCLTEANDQDTPRSVETEHQGGRDLVRYTSHSDLCNNCFDKRYVAALTEALTEARKGDKS